MAYDGFPPLVRAHPYAPSAPVCPPLKPIPDRRAEAQPPPPIGKSALPPMHGYALRTQAASSGLEAGADVGGARQIVQAARREAEKVYTSQHEAEKIYATTAYRTPATHSIGLRKLPEKLPPTSGGSTWHQRAYTLDPSGLHTKFYSTYLSKHRFHERIDTALQQVLKNPDQLPEDPVLAVAEFLKQKAATPAALSAPFGAPKAPPAPAHGSGEGTRGGEPR